MTANGNPAIAQGNRISDLLRIRSFGTLIAHKELNIKHPAARVIELSNGGFEIKKFENDRPNDCEKIHRVTFYLLAGVVTTVPTPKEGRVQKEADQQKHTLEGKL